MVFVNRPLTIHRADWPVQLLTIIAKYGVLIRECHVLYYALLNVSKDKIALRKNLRVDDQTAELAIIGSNELIEKASNAQIHFLTNLCNPRKPDTVKRYKEHYDLLSEQTILSDLNCQGNQIWIDLNILTDIT